MCAHAGWFNLLGQAALTSVIAYTQANQMANMILLGTGGALSGGYAVTNAELLGIFAGSLRPAIPKANCLCILMAASNDKACIGIELRAVWQMGHSTDIQQLPLSS